MHIPYFCSHAQFQLWWSVSMFRFEILVWSRLSFCSWWRTAPMEERLSSWGCYTYSLRLVSGSLCKHAEGWSRRTLILLFPLQIPVLPGADPENFHGRWLTGWLPIETILVQGGGWLIKVDISCTVLHKRSGEGGWLATPSTLLDQPLDGYITGHVLK